MLTNVQVSEGYYTLPNVGRPINPRDPLGLWEVYSEDRSQEEAEKKVETQVNEEAKMPSYADIVKNGKTATKSQTGKCSARKFKDSTRKTTVMKKTEDQETQVQECTQKVAFMKKKEKGISRKRGIDQLGEDFIAQQPRKVICLSEKEEMDKYYVSEEKSCKEKKKISLQMYRQRKALKVVRQKPMALKIKKKSYADALKMCGKSNGKLLSSFASTRRPLRVVN